jgi:hypothetical protein
MKIENLEQLDRILSDMQNEKEKLQNTIEALEYRLDAQRWAWQRHRVMDTKEEPYLDGLPIPRIEMRIEKLNDGRHQMQWIYGLVYKHLTDAESDTLLFIPIGLTSGTGYSQEELKRWTVDNLLPFRDGTHIQTEMKIFNMRAFLVIPGIQRVEEIHYKLSEATTNLVNNILIIKGRMFFETNPGSGYIKL